MGGMWGSRERVEERLSGLEVVYGSFPVDQTTISVPERQFERFYERGAKPFVEVRVEVYNDGGDVLCLRDDSGETLPYTEVGMGEKIEREAQQAVRNQTGVECGVAGLARATIAGIRNASKPDAEVLYFLVVVLRGPKEGGDVGDHAEWRSRMDGRRPLQVS